MRPLGASERQAAAGRSERARRSRFTSGTRLTLLKHDGSIRLVARIAELQKVPPMDGCMYGCMYVWIVSTHARESLSVGGNRAWDAGSIQAVRLAARLYRSSPALTNDPVGGSEVATWQSADAERVRLAASATMRWTGRFAMPMLAKSADSTALRSGARFAEGRARVSGGRLRAWSDRQNSRADSYPMKTPIREA